MAMWNVSWLITVEADSPRLAAEAALKIQRAPFGDAVVFGVSPWDSETGDVEEHVDLAIAEGVDS
jgi:hypothetical protein